MKRSFIFVFLLILISWSVSGQDHLNYCLKTDTFHLVVLGSSTAAGSGASTSDSSWVGRYRNYLQSINPGNQVTNLAVGGFTTWRLMPDGFISPSGRPAPDTNRNISAALALNADAIIINLPSNDAATGVGVNQQMSNFISITSLADSSGVPAWVCTTQPRNGSSSFLQVQMDVRDSIFSYYGPKSIDFWTGVGDSTNQLVYSPYNSGDGVHLNDAGHKLLYERVKNKNILTGIDDTVNGIDLSPVALSWLNPSLCGDSQSVFAVVIANAGGQAAPAGLNCHFEILDQTTGSTVIYTQSLPDSIDPCDSDTLYFTQNTAPASNLKIRAYLSVANDLNAANDTTDWLNIVTNEKPVVVRQDRAFCKGDSAFFTADGADTTLWFQDALSDSIVAFGDSIFLGKIQQSDTLYAAVAQGPFVYREELKAAQSHNIDWNGVMFNLIAGPDTVVIDSIEFTSATAGASVIEARTKSGSYVGDENNAAAWSLWGTDSVNGAMHQSHVVEFGSQTIFPGDTLGVYLSMQSSSHSLSYQSVGSVVQLSAPGLAFRGGTGVSHNFGNTYHPRVFNGQIFYHYGFNPRGQCISERRKVLAEVSSPQVDLGPDTTVYFGMNINLSAPQGYDHYLWSNGDTGSTTSINTGAFQGLTEVNVWVKVTDTVGCMASDTIKVTLDYINTLEENETKEIQVYPNPTTGKIFISPADKVKEVMLITLDGKKLMKRQIRADSQLLEFSLPDLPKGLYFLQVVSRYGFTQSFKIRLQ